MAFASPTVRDFDVIWDVIFNAFDSRWCKRSKGKKIEEVVPFVLKGLGYPSTVSKSALSAPGSTHSWPQILLALDWMVNLINIKAKTLENIHRENHEDKMEMENEDASLDNKKIFEWMVEAYAKYMEFDDEGCKLVDDAFILKIKQDQERQQDYNNKVKEEFAKITREVEALKQTPSPLLKKKAELEEMEQDKMTLKTRIKQLEEVMSRQKKKSSELEISIQMKAKEIEHAIMEIEGLKDRVAKQTVTKEDIRALKNEKNKIEQMLHNAVSHKNSIEQEVNNKEVKLDAMLNALVRLVHEYNNQVRDLNSKENQTELGTDLLICLNGNATRAEEMFDLQHKGAVTVALQGLKEKYVERNKQLVEETKQLEIMYCRQQNEKSKLQQHHQNAAGELERVVEERKHCQESIASLKDNGSEQISLVESEIVSLKEKREQMISSAQQRLTDAETQYHETVAKCNQEREELWKDLSQRVALIKKLREDSTGVFQELHSLKDEALHTFQNISKQHLES